MEEYGFRRQPKPQPPAERLDDPLRRPAAPAPDPVRPDVKKPDMRRLLERMKRVDPDQAKRYRQRSGQ